MAMFNDIVGRAQQNFPELQIKYKNEELLMKIMGFLLFFNPAFMTSYATTVGFTVYFPSRSFVKTSPVTSTVEFMHEIVHLYDEKKYGKSIFLLGYLFPQLLALLSIPLFFLFGWKIALIALIFLAPLPAVFRMLFERKAYSSSLYVMSRLNQINNFKIDLDGHKNHFNVYFKSMDYYLMWPFQDISTFFDNFLVKIKQGEKPVYDEDFYKTIDKILGE